MCEIQLKNRKRSMDLMFMLVLNEAMDQLVMASNVHWYGHVLRIENAHFLRMPLDLEVDCQREKGWLNMIWKRQVEEECVKVGLRMEDANRS